MQKEKIVKLGREKRGSNMLELRSNMLEDSSVHLPD